MKVKTVLRAALATLFLSAFVPAAQAGQWEINPYAGYFFPDSINFDGRSEELKEEGIYGVRAGYFLTKNLELEGNFGYINHFELEGTDPESRGILWEAAGLYHFNYGRFRPFVTAGVGGITAVVDDDDIPVNTLRGFDDGDTFLTFSYGGGVKAPKLWGPIGLRGDVRGRTIPNLHGETTSWLELTGGITLNWGE